MRGRRVSRKLREHACQRRLLKDRNKKSNDLRYCIGGRFESHAYFHSSSRTRFICEYLPHFLLVPSVQLLELLCEPVKQLAVIVADSKQVHFPDHAYRLALLG